MYTPIQTDDTMRHILSLVTAEGIHIQEIADQAGLTLPIAASALVKLEIKEKVSQIPGKRYKLKGGSNG